jgi:hypothetical protein
MLELVKYIKEHGLDKTLKDFRLKSRDYPNKVLIKYDQIESSMGERVVQEARGIVLEKDTWKVMSLPFFKFFNAAEGHAAKIDWNTAHILEKCDGTMIHLYWDWNKNTWWAATTGTAEGEGEVNNKLGTTFNELFWATVSDKYGLTPDSRFLEKTFVYVFELTTPYNIVVKPHGESSVTLLTMRNRNTLEELPYHILRSKAEEFINVPLVKSFDLNRSKNMDVGVLERTLEDMPWDEEGYVVVDADFNRIKVKNPAYVAVHHLKSKTSEHAIMSVVKTNEIDEFIATFPERADEITNLHTSYNDLISRLEEGWNELKDRKPKNITPKEKKKYAMAVFEVIGKLDLKDFAGLYFSLNDGKVDSVKEFMFNYDNKKLYKML